MDGCRRITFNLLPDTLCFYNYHTSACGALFFVPGIVNLLVGTAPLLKTLPHAVLLTSLMASLANLHRYRDTAEFQEKLLCMSPHVAGILLGEYKEWCCVDVLPSPFLGRSR